MSDPAAEFPAKKKLSVRDPSRTSSGGRKGKTKSRKKKTGQRHVLESAAQILISLSVVVAPWLYGSVSALAQLVLGSIAAVCVLLLIVCLFAGRVERPRFQTATLLVWIFLIIGLLQQVNLPDGVVNVVAKPQMELRDRLASGLGMNHPETAERIAADHRMVINAPAARYQYGYFLLVGCLFFLGARFGDRREDLIRLAVVVAVNGALLSVFGVFQKVADPESIYGQPLRFGGTPFGPFVNRNNAGGFLLVCFACGMAALTYAFSGLKERTLDRRETQLSRENLFARLGTDLRTLIANLTVWRIVLLAINGLIIMGIVLTTSRGAVLALGATTIALLVCLFRIQKYRLLLLVAVILIPLSLGAITWSGLQGDVSERLESLQEDDLISTETRVKLWRDGWEAVKANPLFGFGVGSYPYIYKEYQTFIDSSWYFHAENVFLEGLITLGILGVIPVVLLMVLLARGIWLYTRTESEDQKITPKTTATIVLGVLLLVSQLVSNFFDFGFLIPSNGLLIALLAGSLFGVRCRTELKEKKRPRRFAVLPGWTVWPITAGLLLGCLVFLHVFWYENITERAVLAARTDDINALTPEQVDQSIARLETAIQGATSLQAHQFLATLHVLKLQHRFVDDQLEAISDPSVTRKQVWENSTLRMINFQLSRLTPEIRKQEIQRLMSRPYFQKEIAAAEEQNEQALETCPRSVRSLVNLAELAYLTQKPVEAYLTTFDRFNVNRPTWFLRMGNVAVAHHEKNIALRYWKRAIALDESSTAIIVPTALFFLEPGTICQDLIPPNPKILDDVAEKYFAASNVAELREMLYRRIVKILSAEKYPDAQSHFLLGKARIETGDVLGAISSFESACMLEPLNYRWRAKLARLYFDVGKVQQAQTEIEKCVIAEPENLEFKRLQKAFR